MNVCLCINWQNGNGNKDRSFSILQICVEISNTIPKWCDANKQRWQWHLESWCVYENSPQKNEPTCVTYFISTKIIHINICTFFFSLKFKWCLIVTHQTKNWEIPSIYTCDFYAKQKTNEIVEFVYLILYFLLVMKLKLG